MSENLWLMNTHHEEVSIPMLDINPPRIQVFRPNRPLPFPRNIALSYMNKFRTIKLVDPKPFIQNNPFTRMVIRDMGLGDMILLEPVLRAMSDANQEITLMTAFPEVFEGHPAIKDIVRMKEHKVAQYNPGQYDMITDLMYKVETHEKRSQTHRTDLFGMVADVKLDNKEPRLYRKLQSPPFQKQPGKKYIGIEFDANSNYRRYPEPLARAVIQYIADKDLNNIVVILGRRPYILPTERKNVIDLQGKTTLTQCFDAIGALDAMIACDSGLLHVALALHIPTVAWFSIISPDLRMRYYTGGKEILVKNMACRPCGDGSAGDCIHGSAADDPDYRIPKFIAPCAKIEPKEFYEKLMSLPKCNGPMVYTK